MKIPGLLVLLIVSIFLYQTINKVAFLTYIEATLTDVTDSIFEKSINYDS
jgi:hypothetical protein